MSGAKAAAQRPKKAKHLRETGRHKRSTEAERAAYRAQKAAHRDALRKKRKPGRRSVVVRPAGTRVG